MKQYFTFRKAEFKPAFLDYGNKIISLVIRERVLFDSSAGWGIETWPGWKLLDTVVGVLLGRLPTKPVSTRPFQTLLAGGLD